MCGIVGILGAADVVDRLMDGLSRLEYRGYDSAGIAVMTPEAGLQTRRASGKLSSLRGLLNDHRIAGTAGIGHTRWATHGAPTQRNAHPHRAGPVTVVHNGIIENYAELRGDLQQRGVRFTSDTDTEVVAQLCAETLDQGGDPIEAVAETLERLSGAYALAFLFEDQPELMIAARRGSPLALGYGDAAPDGTCEMFVGSDALALAPFTQNVCFLEEGDLAVITRRRTVIRDRDGQEVVRAVQTLPEEDWRVEKGPFRHFMAKEIHEQPESLSRALTQFADHHAGGLRPILSGIDLASVDRVILVACGTSHYACLSGKYWLEQFAGLPVEVDIASEYRYRQPAFSGRELAVFVSQSGETADTLAAMSHLRGRVATRLAVVNVPTSSMAREADGMLEILAGPEIGVASTKAFTGQLLALAALAMAMGKARGRICAEAERALVTELSALPRLVRDVLELEPVIARQAEATAKASTALFLGRGPSYPIALEGALKMKEVSYITAEGYPAGELKHGPIAQVDKDVPVVVLAPRDALFDKTLTNAEEVAARGGRVVIVSDAALDGRQGASGFDHIRLPDLPPSVAPVGLAVVMQLLAYHVAVCKGTDVDQPRNLAKSVTVE
ncbi:glutamine--fructose-6-phosphate transaminase (isomerizing) [Aquicoccus sp. SU-CL01552]|uniref:glutamine--fructose-6-phosphate transaminase (isomerizing) n=1 Tax=Aquicoccus sp. SU-CL01552 TaxID=3127656 RepID=UPI0031030F36